MAAKAATRRSPARTGRGARPAPPRRGPGLAAAAFTLAGVAVLVGLGVWQLQRKVWKEHLLASIAALQTAPPEPLNVVLNRLSDGGEVDFVRVVAACDARLPKSVNLYGLREGAGPGWRQIIACRLPPGGAYGSLLIDAGYEAGAAMAPPTPQVVTLPQTGARVTGVLRTPEPRPWFASLVGLGARGVVQSQATGQWFQRDIPGMAAALGAPRPAPVMLLLESPVAGPKLQPAALPTDIPNRHFEYALTWFGLAGTLVVFYAANVLRGRGTTARSRRRVAR